MRLWWRMKMVRSMPFRGRYRLMESTMPGWDRCGFTGAPVRVTSALTWAMRRLCQGLGRAPGDRE